MRILEIIWLREVVDKLIAKHSVETFEVEEVFNDEPKTRYLQKGDREGEDVYVTLGKTDAGRYLAVLFVFKKTHEALVLSARDMATKERRQYG